MKQILAILLLASFSMQCFSRLTVFVSFELNKDYIATHLCVNRDNPSVQCHGQCFLKKELHQNQERQNHEKENTGNRIVLFFSRPEEGYSLHIPFNLINLTFDNRAKDYRFTPLLSHFRPPRTMA